jgi:hypothetical protein
MKDQGMEILAARGGHMLVVGTPLERTFEQIRFVSILPMGSELIFTRLAPPTHVTANLVEYATIRMDGEELTN